MITLRFEKTQGNRRDDDFFARGVSDKTAWHTIYQARSSITLDLVDLY